MMSHGAQHSGGYAGYVLPLAAPWLHTGGQVKKKRRFSHASQRAAVAAKAEISLKRVPPFFVHSTRENISHTKMRCFGWKGTGTLVRGLWALTLAVALLSRSKRYNIFRVGIFLLISLDSPHVRPMGCTCGGPNEIELATVGVVLNGSRWLWRCYFARV